jgi:hypothetical protein
MFIPPRASEASPRPAVAAKSERLGVAPLSIGAS